MSRFVTLADLHAERFNLGLRCTSCLKITEKTMHQLTGQPWTPDSELTGLDETITSIVSRLKCSRCGCREVEWWPTKSGAAMNDWYVARG